MAFHQFREALKKRLGLDTPSSSPSSDPDKAHTVIFGGTNRSARESFPDDTQVLGPMVKEDEYGSEHASGRLIDGPGYQHGSHLHGHAQPLSPVANAYQRALALLNGDGPGGMEANTRKATDYLRVLSPFTSVDIKGYSRGAVSAAYTAAQLIQKYQFTHVSADLRDPVAGPYSVTIEVPAAHRNVVSSYAPPFFIPATIKGPSQTLVLIDGGHDAAARNNASIGLPPLAKTGSAIYIDTGAGFKKTSDRSELTTYVHGLMTIPGAERWRRHMFNSASLFGDNADPTPRQVATDDMIDANLETQRMSKHPSP